MQCWGHYIGGKGVSYLNPRVLDPTKFTVHRSKPHIVSYGELKLVSKCHSGTHMDNCSMGLDCKLSYIIEFFEAQHMCLGVVDVMELSTSS